MEIVKPEERKKIIIIDDTKVFLKIFSSFLKEYEVETFLDPKEGLEAIKKNAPDLVLSDLEMPGMNGIELLKEVRRDKALKNLPFIICTSHNTDDLLEEAFRAGVTDFLGKENISGLVLQIRVKNTLDSVRKTKIIKRIAENNTTLVRVLCHDLVNPLSIVKGYFTILKSVTNNPKASNPINKMAIGLEKIQHIITYSRDQLSLKDKVSETIIEKCSLDFLVKDLSFLLDELLEKKKIHFKMNCPDHPIEFLCEKSSVVNQVFSNLFTNAIKFTPEDGYINFDISEDETHTIFEIKDTGIGIPPSLIEKLFNAEANTSRAGTNGEKGTGYGLPLVKAFVNNYGGTIKVESQCREDFPTNHWTKFTIRLKKA